ncbi:MAG: PD-(D/E)XK nuclease family protein [Limnothrix sp. CACIAM 69d]|nr:MAG: PD-(D/E)XK nuclease family protein [Limnothrix sp. CACIAM 69d]
MSYRLSPAKLTTYQTCPARYQFRYEYKIPTVGFGGAALGRSLHGALTRIYRDWDYSYPQKPGLSWIDACWTQETASLTERQIAEGYDILVRYFHHWIEPSDRFLKPLATEAKIQGRLQINDLEFALTGRLDRLDWFDLDSLELIEYKTSRQFVEPDLDQLTMQVGLYAIAINQQWERELKYINLIFLRPGESVRIPVTEERLIAAQAVIADLAQRLRTDRAWEPNPGTHCDQCHYKQYCPAQTTSPEPIPTPNHPASILQLSLNLKP